VEKNRKLYRGIAYIITHAYIAYIIIHSFRGLSLERQEELNNS